jgi:hypothetical protein
MPVEAEHVLARAIASLPENVRGRLLRTAAPRAKPYAKSTVIRKMAPMSDAAEDRAYVAYLATLAYANAVERSITTLPRDPGAEVVRGYIDLPGWRQFVKVVTAASGKHSVRYGLNGARFTRLGEAWWLIASNGHVLAGVQIPNELVDVEPAWDTLGRNPSIILRGRATDDWEAAQVLDDGFVVGERDRGAIEHDTVPAYTAAMPVADGRDLLMRVRAGALADALREIRAHEGYKRAVDYMDRAIPVSLVKNANGIVVQFSVRDEDDKPDLDAMLLSAADGGPFRSDVVGVNVDYVYDALRLFHKDDVIAVYNEHPLSPLAFMLDGDNVSGGTAETPPEKPTPYALVMPVRLD